MTATTKISRELKLAIFAGCMISFISFGFSASFSVFLRPMSIELGWGREVFSLSLAIQALMWGVTQPLAGIYADKHGASRVLAFGAVVAALGFALRGVFDDPTLFIQTGFIVGVGTGACSFPVVIVALGKVVQPAQRSFIMGLGTAAASAGMFAGAPIATTLIGLMGWGDCPRPDRNSAAFTDPRNTRCTGQGRGIVNRVLGWYRLPGSNGGPLDPQSSALTN